MALCSLNRRRFLQFCGASLLVGAGARYLDFEPIPTQLPLIRYTANDIKNLRFTIHPKMDLPHQVKPTEAMLLGMRKHGLNVEVAEWDTPSTADIPIVWTWKQGRVIAQAKRQGRNVMVMEWGFLQPRKEWTSIGFNGLNGYGTFAQAPKGRESERFERYFSDQLKPWRRSHSGPVLLIGQVPWDASLHGLDMSAWLQEMADAARALGHEVIYRPHPVHVGYNEKRGRPIFVPKGAVRSDIQSMAEDMARASFLIVYSSTAAVDATMAGIPAVVMSQGSVAWDLTSHDISAPNVYAEREAWCRQLAWQQWTFEELSSGEAWEYAHRAILA